MTVVIGLDVGGTAIKAVRIDGGQIIAGRATVAAGGAIPRDDLVARIRVCVAELAGDASPDAAGLTFGGMIQADGAMRQGSTNLPNLDGVPLAAFFSDLLAMPCRVENDAIAAMRGEAALGAARDLRHAMTLTFGMGIGGGLLLDGRIHRGAHGRAGEIGLWRLAPPAAGDDGGPWEDIAAPGRFARREGQDFADAFRRRDSDCGARRRMDRIFELAGRAIANAHLLADLEAVILMGRVVALGEPFRRAVEEAYRAALAPEFRCGLEIRFGELGPYAGAVGAAALWFAERRP